MKYSVAVRKGHLNFSSSHFVVEGGRCESLHGHNYNASAEIEGTLDSTGYVADFVALKRMLQEIISPLDHKVLIASQNPSLKIIEGGEEIEISFREKRFVLPRPDCVLLPMPNCTSEYMASYILSRLKARLFEEGYRNLFKIKVGVEESFGQWGFAEEEIKP